MLWQNNPGTIAAAVEVDYIDEGTVGEKQPLLNFVFPFVVDESNPKVTKPVDMREIEIQNTVWKIAGVKDRGFESEGEVRLVFCQPYSYADKDNLRQTPLYLKDTQFRIFNNNLIPFVDLKATPLPIAEVLLPPSHLWICQPNDLGQPTLADHVRHFLKINGLSDVKVDISSHKYRSAK